MTIIVLFTARKRSLRRLCFYTCVSVHGGGGSTWAGTPPRTRYTPRPATPPGTRYPPGPGTPPWDQVPPRTRYTPWDQVHSPGTWYTPRTRYPPPQGPGTPWDQVHPPGPGIPRTRYPPGAVHAGRYGQQAGGTHPTGMHSFCTCVHKH